MSKMFQILSMMAISAGVVAESPQPVDAGNLPARGGKTDYPTSEPGCWGVSGPTIQNNCTQGKYWYMPLGGVGAGRFWVTVTAQAASISNNVQCISTGSNREGTSFTQSAWVPLSQFGAASNINLDTTVPSGGSGMVDCYALSGGKLHTLSW